MNLLSTKSDNQQKETRHFFVTVFFSIAVVMMLLPAKVFAQSLGINTSGALPDSSAMLDIISAHKGLLVPRVSLTSTTDTTTIVKPATSLIVYNTNASITGGSGAGYYYYSGSGWLNFLSGAGSSGYIQNQTASDQAAGLRLTGNGLFNGGQLTIGTATPSSGYLLTMNTSSGIGKALNLTLSGGSGTGINISTSSSAYSGMLFTNSTSSTSATFNGIGAVLSSTNIVSGYMGYRTSSGLSYGIYGINGTSSTYATNSSTWAAFLRGRTVISSETSPSSGLGTDLEIRNTTTGAGNPATVSLRQENSNSTNATVLTNLNFGDNYQTGPEAQIQVARGAAGGSGDLPTDMIFSTTPDASSTLTERMRILNNGNVGIGTTSPPVMLTVLNNNGVKAAIVKSLVDIGSSNTTVIGSNYLQLGQQESGANSYRLIEFGYNVGMTSNSPAYIGYQEIGATTYTKGDLVFGTRDVVTNTQASERMRINTAGNVGIGTTTPTSTLHVTGSVASSYALLTSATTLDGTYYNVNLTNAGSTYAITLPAASGATGRTYRVKQMSGTACTVTSASNFLTITGGSAGSVTLTVGTRYIEFQSDGTNWVVNQ